VKTRKPLAILAATAITGLGLTALATPASADTPVTASGGYDNPTFSRTSITDTGFTFTNSSANFYVFESEFISDGNGINCADPDADECKVNKDEEETFQILPGASNAQVIWTNSNQDVTGTAFTVTYLGESNPSNDSASGSTPAPRIQQFEKPATGTCDEAAPEGLNWGGASSGGWGESWAQWVNEGQGGAVCTRTLDYNNSTATWQVQ